MTTAGSTLMASAAPGDAEVPLGGPRPVAEGRRIAQSAEIVARFGSLKRAFALVKR